MLTALPGSFSLELEAEEGIIADLLVVLAEDSCADAAAAAPATFEFGTGD